MGHAFKLKTTEELELISKEAPGNSGLYIEARKELKRREFWRKDIISWLALIISILALTVKMVG